MTPSTTPRCAPWTPVALAAGALLLLAACGSAGDGSAAADPSARPAARAGASTSGGAEHRSPLDELFAQDMAAKDDPQEELDKQREVEERIAACMRDAGFLYVAVDPTADPTGTAALAALPPDEFARRYGYGITTIDIRELAQHDPNTVIADELSPDATRRYSEALNGAEQTAAKYGEQPPADAAAHPGCRAEAEQAVYGDQEKTPPPAGLTALLDQMDDLWDRIMDDPRVDAAADEWAACMHEAGYPDLREPDDAQATIIRRQWQLYGVEAPSNVLHSRRTDRRGRELPLPPGPPRQGHEPDEDALAELQDDEIAMAVADRGCRPAYDEVVAQVQDEVEQAFIDDHRAELDRYFDTPD
jgi:hypothetical protein